MRRIAAAAAAFLWAAGLAHGQAVQVPTPLATTSQVGKVKPDGVTVTIDANGTITSTTGGGGGNQSASRVYAGPVSPSSPASPSFRLLGLSDLPGLSATTLLGNPTGTGGASEQEITLGTNLSFSGNVLNATGGITSLLAGCGLTGGTITTTGTIAAAGRTAHGNSDFTIGATVNYAALNVDLTAPRTWTLPAANALAAGCTIKIAGEVANTPTATNTLNVVPAGADTINGGVGYLLYAPYMALYATTDGVSAWTVTSSINVPPLTSGGIWYGDATPLPKNLPKGTDGQVLTLVSGLPGWAANIAAGCATGTANVLPKSTGSGCANSGFSDPGSTGVTVALSADADLSGDAGLQITSAALNYSLALVPGVGVTSGPTFSLNGYGTNATFQTLYSAGFRGTEDFPQNNDTMSDWQVAGWNGTAYQRGAYIDAVATETWTPTQNGTSLHFATTATGAASPTDRLTIAGNGGITVGAPGGGTQGAGTVNATGLFKNGVAVKTFSTEHISFQPGLLTSVLNTKGIYHKFTSASTVTNLIASALSFTCAVNPVITLYECGTSATCASPATIGSVTVTAAGTATVGTISAAAITAGDYVGFSISSGTCTALDIQAAAEVTTP